MTKLVKWFPGVQQFMSPTRRQELKGRRVFVPEVERKELCKRSEDTEIKRRVKSEETIQEMDLYNPPTERQKLITQVYNSKIVH